MEKPRIVINVPSRTLTLYDGEQRVRQFPVGLGRKAFPTPVGVFQVRRKIRNPGWENPYRKKGAIRIAPGKRNPLGTRWIGFKEYKGGEYGIHGTDRPESVGKFSSHGCVRMRIPDAEAVFEAVSVGTPVSITYDLTDVIAEAGQVILKLYPDIYGMGLPSLDTIRAEIQSAFAGVLLDEPRLSQIPRYPQSTVSMPVGQLPPS